MDRATAPSEKVSWSTSPLSPAIRSGDYLSVLG